LETGAELVRAHGDIEEIVRNIPGRSTLVFGTSTDLDGDLDRIAKTHTDDLINGFTDTGAEKTRPPLLRKMTQNSLQVVLEPEIQQAIGFIQY
jgi:hypothetical protein